MINFLLDLNEFKKTLLKIDDLKIIEISNRLSIECYKYDIIKLIENFNKEYDWDGMFTYEDVIKRIESFHFMYVLFYKRNCIGYVFYQPLSKNDFWLYNLYVSNQIERSSEFPIWFVNQSITNLCNLRKNIKYISCECEDWHTSAHNVFLSNNFKKI